MLDATRRLGNGVVDHFGIPCVASQRGSDGMTFLEFRNYSENKQDAMAIPQIPKSDALPAKIGRSDALRRPGSAYRH
jgi:hypothetical protein